MLVFFVFFFGTIHLTALSSMGRFNQINLAPNHNRLASVNIHHLLLPLRLHWRRIYLTTGYMGYSGGPVCEKKKNCAHSLLMSLGHVAKQTSSAKTNKYIEKCLILLLHYLILVRFLSSETDEIELQQFVLLIYNSRDFSVFGLVSLHRWSNSLTYARLALTITHSRGRKLETLSDVV